MMGDVFLFAKSHNILQDFSHVKSQGKTADEFK